MIFMSCVPTRIEIPVSVIIKRQTHLNSFSFDKNFILQHSLHMILSMERFWTSPYSIYRFRLLQFRPKQKERPPISRKPFVSSWCTFLSIFLFFSSCDLAETQDWGKSSNPPVTDCNLSSAQIGVSGYFLFAVSRFTSQRISILIIL